MFAGHTTHTHRHIVGSRETNRVVLLASAFFFRLPSQFPHPLVALHLLLLAHIVHGGKKCGRKNGTHLGEKLLAGREKRIKNKNAWERTKEWRGLVVKYEQNLIMPLTLDETDMKRPFTKVRGIHGGKMSKNCL